MNALAEVKVVAGLRSWLHRGTCRLMYLQGELWWLAQGPRFLRQDLDNLDERVTEASADIDPAAIHESNVAARAVARNPAGD